MAFKMLLIYIRVAVIHSIPNSNGKERECDKQFLSQQVSAAVIMWEQPCIDNIIKQACVLIKFIYRCWYPGPEKETLTTN